MTPQEHLAAARAVAATINHVKPCNRAVRVKTCAEHVKAMLAAPAVMIRGQGRLV